MTPTPDPIELLNQQTHGAISRTVAIFSLSGDVDMGAIADFLNSYPRNRATVHRTFPSPPLTGRNVRVDRANDALYLTTDDEVVQVPAGQTESLVVATAPTLTDDQATLLRNAVNVYRERFPDDSLKTAAESVARYLGLDVEMVRTLVNEDDDAFDDQL